MRESNLIEKNMPGDITNQDMIDQYSREPGILIKNNSEGTQKQRMLKTVEEYDKLYHEMTDKKLLLDATAIIENPMI